VTLNLTHQLMDADDTGGTSLDRIARKTILQHPPASTPFGLPTVRNQQVILSYLPKTRRASYSPTDHLTRSRHLPVAVVEGKRTRNRSTSVRLWTESPAILVSRLPTVSTMPASSG
jgi:hypothetical protein